MTSFGSGIGYKSVDIRVKQLPKLYKVKAKNINKNYCGSAEGQIGPVETYLEQFGEIGCYVIGRFGEGSHYLQFKKIKMLS